MVEASVTGADQARKDGMQVKECDWIVWAKFRHARNPDRADEWELVSVSFNASNERVYPEGGIPHVGRTVLLGDRQHYYGKWRAFRVVTKSL
jgi:hypothetical protein